VRVLAFQVGSDEVGDLRVYDLEGTGVNHDVSLLERCKLP
jgi:hypothetical protein